MKPGTKEARFSVGKKKILLLGFPNVGKSLLFHHLTGVYAVVSNYPGTTVEVTRGAGKIAGREVEIVDTPGLYSLQGYTPEEEVALKVLKQDQPELILFVVEAAALPRMIYLLSDLKGLNVPLVLVLNMMDEAQRRGIILDVKSLEKELQIPVVATVGSRKIGVDRLKQVIKNVLFVPSSPGNGEESKETGRFAGRKVVGFRDKESFSLYEQKSRLHLLLINPWIGYPLTFFLLFFVFYYFIGVLGAGTVVNFIEKKIFLEIANPVCSLWLEKYVPLPLLKEIIIGDYGLVSMGLRYSLAIVLPLVSMFFLVFAVLEDSGYLPRLSYLLHRPLGCLGLDGRGAIPLMMGFGCGTMAVLVTRLLETPRERFIATFLLSLGIPCSAQLGLLIGILAPYPRLVMIWGFTWGLFFAGAGLVLNRFYPGKRRYSCLEFPPLRLPQLSAVCRKTLVRIYWYLREVVPFFLIISVVFQILNTTGFLSSLQSFMAPAFAVLGLPSYAVEVFLVGFLRRDYAAAGLYDLMHQGLLSPESALISAVVLTLFFPCLAQLVIIIKERGWKESLLILSLITLTSYGAGYLLHLIISFGEV